MLVIPFLNADQRFVMLAFIVSVRDLAGTGSISRDIAAMLKSKRNELEMNHIEQLAARLGFSSLWKEMLDNVS